MCERSGVAGGADEPPEVLSIGLIYDPSPDGARWRDAILGLGASVRERRGGVESPLNVNVVFQVPGRLLQCEFEGVRTGRYDRSQRHLLVQAAVPVDRYEEAESVSRELLRAAVDEAERWAIRKRISDGLPQLRELAEEL